MTVRRRKNTLVFDWGDNIEEFRELTAWMRNSTIMVLPTKRKTAYVYGYEVFSKSLTAGHLNTLYNALDSLKAQKFSVYVSSQAMTILSRKNDIKRLEMILKFK